MINIQISSVYSTNIPKFIKFGSSGRNGCVGVAPIDCEGASVVRFPSFIRTKRDGGLGVLGVRVRMKATFTTRNSHFVAVRVRGCP